MDKMNIYNKKPSEAKKKEIIKLLTPEATKVKEAIEVKEAKVKGLKQQVKKIKKVSKVKDKEDRNLLQEFEQLLLTDETAVDKLQSILDKFKKKEEKAPEAVVAKSTYRGENYRS